MYKVLVCYLFQFFQLYYQFYIKKESKLYYLLTGSTHIPISFSSSSSGFIVTTTPTVTQGK